jgi:hypothetical protein
MILMKAADEAGECLVRASELSRLSICVFAGHHGTCPFKFDLHIQYAFRYTMSLILLECLATNFVAWISRQVHRGAKRRGGCISPHLANGMRIIRPRSRTAQKAISTFSRFLRGEPASHRTFSQSSRTRLCALSVAGGPQCITFRGGTASLPD